MAYRPDVYHRSVDFTDPTRYRVMLHVSFRHRDAGWGGYQAWPFRGFSSELSKFVQQATPRQLALMGVPEPGHPYWNEATLTGVQARYPGLDMTPWRDAARATPRAATPVRRGPGHGTLRHERQVEQQLLAVVPGQHLQTRRAARPPARPGCSWQGCR